MTDLNAYQKFVYSVTSDPSRDIESLVERLRELNEVVNIAQLMTGSQGLASEGGEFAEIVKKCVYQGKPLDEDTIYHIKRELGDIAFYWAMAAEAIGFTPDDIIQENIRKLEKRYPGGFSVHRSENRETGDL